MKGTLLEGEPPSAGPTTIGQYGVEACDQNRQRARLTGREALYSQHDLVAVEEPGHDQDVS